MKIESHKCSKCNSPMKIGITVMHGNTWIEKDISNLDKKITPKVVGFMNRAKSYNIISYSCTKCGYIEQFVDRSR